MGLPPANTVLFFLSAFTGLWGLSVILRGLNARRVAGSRRCPECEADMRETPGRVCPACAYDAPSEEALVHRRRDWRLILVGAVASTTGLALVPIALWVRRWETTGYDDGLGMHPLSAAFYGVAAFGLVLALWAWRGDRSKGRRRCPRCWYDMSATIARESVTAASMTCPECGHQPTSARALYRPRRRPRTALLAVAVLILGLCGQTVPRALRTGPLGLVPTTVLIAGSRVLPESWYVDPTGMSEATLERRVWNRELWEWQSDLGRWIARSQVRQNLLHGRPATTTTLLDSQSPIDQAAVLTSLVRLLGNDDHLLTQAESDQLLQSFGSFVPWRGLPEELQVFHELRRSISDCTPSLLRGAQSGCDSEAFMCLLLVNLQPPEDTEWIATLAICAKTGGTSTRRLASRLLGSAAAERLPEALEQIEGMLGLDPTTQQYAVFAIWNAIQTEELRPWLEEWLLRIVRTNPDAEVVAGAARVLASECAESPAFRELAASPYLPQAARRGFADAWSSSPQTSLPEMATYLLPGLQGDSPDTLHAILFCLNRYAGDPTLPSVRMVEFVIPLLDHEDAGVGRAAFELLRTIRNNQPQLAATIDPELAAHAELGQGLRPIPDD